MAGLLDFLQSASNAAASNVAGPIDLLGWALNKAGVPVGAPVGGSEWMKRKGLMRDVPQSAVSLAGETVGLLSPVVAAAKAPQIAAGLLAGQDAAKKGAVAVGRQASDMAGDYMARQGLLQPATVWHGSPHKFDKFDSTKIGTGEGAQAYGHGLYLADSPGVAKSYQQKLATNEVTYKGQPYKPVRSATDPQSMGLNALSIEPGPLEAAAELRAAAADDAVWVGYGASDKALRPKYVEAADWLEKNAADITVNNGSLYKVDLPDEAIARMLDWDKPLGKQVPQVQKAIKSRLKELGYSPTAQGLRAYHIEHGGFADSTGETLARKFFGDTPEAGAAFMRQQGIPGIRYLDGGSRGAGQGTSNYVVFPGEEGLLTILERNGKPIGLLGE